MNNVVQFPTEHARHSKGNKVAGYRKKMENLAKMLDARYEHLSELAEAIGVIEKECEKFEKQYEIILQEYAKRIGPENVEIKFYDYSNEVEIEFDADMGTFYMAGVDRTADHREVDHIIVDDGDDVA